MGSRHTNFDIAPAILKYFSDRPGVQVFRGDIAKDLNLSEKQVVSAVYALRYRDVDNAKDKIEVIMPGRAWRFNPKPNTVRLGVVKRIFEELTTTKSGTLLIQDQDGNIYRATEVD